MTREEFDKTGFGANMKASYDDGIIYKVQSVSFTEGLVGLIDVDEFDDVFWVRCESIDLV
tara:strand:- start:278 stop:457 length:180 start_codon:yes stop_codon:yes gene_type:complete